MSLIYQQFSKAQMYGGEICIYREYAYYYITAIPFLSGIYQKSDFTGLIDNLIPQFQHFTS